MLLLPMFFTSGCASRGEIKRFQAQVDSLTVINTMQSRNIMRLDSLLTEEARLSRAIRAEQNANAIALQEQMRILESILRDSGYKVSSLGDRIELLEDDISRSSGAHRDTNGSLPDSMESLFDVRSNEIFTTAKLDLNRGKYDLAIMGFESYLDQFPDGSLADDSRYYIGEALLAKGEYTEAAISYLTVTRKWPTSDLVPPALYKAGYCYKVMDQKDIADQYFKKLIDDYPSSPEAELARQQL